MKKTIALLLMLGLMVSLCACGAQEEEPAQVGDNLVPMEPVEPEETLDVEEILAASQTNASALAAQEPPASATDADLDKAAYETAREFIGQQAADMQAAIGEPTSVQYASSCLEEGAEDGMLFYPGFYVWTVRNGGDETVHDVYLNG